MNVTDTYLTLMSPNNFLFKKMYGGVLQEVHLWALEKFRTKQGIRGGLSSSQIIIWASVSVLSKADCLSGEWDTYVCKHADYKGKSRERRDCLIYQGMNFFLVQTAMAITLDNPSQPLPPKEINPLISLG